ncbi:MAG: hypothetical protein KGO05_12490 [Chloroflexota bacterium]|nr:hypothetical protein [Chloroflexota bacterium]
MLNVAPSPYTFPVDATTDESSTPGVGVGGIAVGVAVGLPGGVVGVAVGEPPGVGEAPAGGVVGVGVGVSLATGALVGARPLCVVGGEITLVVCVALVDVVVVLPVVGVWVGAGALVVGVTVTL